MEQFRDFPVNSIDTNRAALLNALHEAVIERLAKDADVDKHTVRQCLQMEELDFIKSSEADMPYSEHYTVIAEQIGYTFGHHHGYEIAAFDDNQLVLRPVDASNNSDKMFLSCLVSPNGKLEYTKYRLDSLNDDMLDEVTPQDTAIFDQFFEHIKGGCKRLGTSNG